METQPIPPNLQLMQARERANWSLERVAFTLNLPTFAISALEEGRYERLHGETFVFGYMRSYAELFGLDADAIVAQYKSSSSVCPEEIVNKPEFRTFTSGVLLHHQKYRTGYGIAAAATLMAALSMLSPQDLPVDKPESQGISVETAVGTTVIDSMESLPVDNPTQDMLPTVISEQSLSQEQIDQQLKNRILGGGAESVSPLVDKSSLSFRFSADCWVEIKDGDNKIIFASLQKAQERIELSGKPPFHITLGYAPGVVLSYNGEPVLIDTNQENIARLVLGNS